MADSISTIASNLGTITLVGGENQVTLIGGNGNESIISGTIFSSSSSDTVVVNDGTYLTISSGGSIISSEGDATSRVTLVGGAPAPIPQSSDVSSESISLDSLASGNGSFNRPLKRMELVYKTTSLKFAINPSDYTQKEPNRATITQTKGGAWIDAWGAGIVEFNIKGITGVSGRKTAGDSSSGNSIDTGYQRWKALRDLFREVYQAIQDGEPVTELIKLYNYTDNEFWYCYPTQTGIELYRSRSKPHIYQYTISLWGLRRIGEPETTTGVIGNPNKEVPIDGVDNSDSGGDEDVNNANDSNTLTNSNVSVQGGNAYVTKTLIPGTQADVSIVTNTRTKTNSIIHDQCSNYAQELAPIIGGHNGQLSPRTAYNCAKNLNISNAGIVINIKKFDARTLNRDAIENTDGYLKFHKLIEEMLFAPLVSRETYSLQQDILDYSPDVLSPEYVLPIGSTPKERVMQAVKQSSKLDSTLYQLIVDYQPKYYLSKLDVKYLYIVILESMMLYRQIYQIATSKGQIITSLTPSGMKTLIKNIDALIIYLESNLTETNEFFVQDVMWELRKLEYIVIQIAADVVEYV